MGGFFLFSLVEWAVWVAVLLYAYSRGGPGLAGVAGVAQLLPAAALAPMFGSVGDRLPRGAALSGTYAAEAVALALLGAILLADAPVAAVVTAATIVTIIISVARPIHYAALPQLAGTPRALASANAASGAAEGFGAIGGPVVAGLITQAAGPWLVAGLSALALVTAALSTMRLRLPVSSERADGDSNLRSAVAGLRSVSRDTGVLALLVVLGVAFVVSGTLEILGVSFAKSVLDAGDSAAGVVVSAPGVGLLAGAACAAGLAARVRLSTSIVVGLVVAGAPLVLMTAAGSLSAAVVLLTICGFGQAVTSVAGHTLIQRCTDDGVLARVFAVQEGVMLAGFAAGAALAPLLIDRLGPVRGYLPLGLGVVVIALLAWPLLHRLDPRVPARPDVLAMLRRAPFLQAIPPFALERLAQTARWVELPVGDVAVHQGDAADALFMVAAGRLSVSVDGAVRAPELEAGDAFGEITLRQDIRRTATVAAIEPCRLLRLERASFLAAVTASSDGRLIATQPAQTLSPREAGLEG
jgi:MFS family permease